QRNSEPKRVATRGVELRIREVEIGGANRGVGESVVERRREARIKVVRPQRLERVAIHRERLGWAFVREGLGEIAKLKHAAERAERGPRLRDGLPVERAGAGPRAASGPRARAGVRERAG